MTKYTADTYTTAQGPRDSNKVIISAPTGMIFQSGTYNLYLGGDLDSSSETATIYVDGTAVYSSAYGASTSSTLVRYATGLALPSSIVGKSSFEVYHASNNTGVNASYNNSDTSQPVADGFEDPGARTVYSRVFYGFDVVVGYDYTVEPEVASSAASGDWTPPVGTEPGIYELEVRTSDAYQWGEWSAPVQIEVFDNKLPGKPIIAPTSKATKPGMAVDMAWWYNSRDEDAQNKYQVRWRKKI